MTDEIGKYVIGGEPARMFGDGVIVYSEMHVRKIVLDVMKAAEQKSERPCCNCGRSGSGVHTDWCSSRLGKSVAQ